MRQKKVKTTLVKTTEPLYRYWQVMYLACCYPRVYIEVIKKWHGLALTYLLLLVLLFSLPLSIRMSVDFNDYLQTHLVQVINLVPEIYVQNGRVQFDKPMPYLIKNKKNQVVLIIDTTGKTMFTEQEKYPDLSLLITKDTIYYRSPNYQFFKNQVGEPAFGPTFEQKLDSSMNDIFKGHDFVRYAHIERIKWLSILIIYPMMASIFFALLAVLFAVLSLLAQFVGKVILGVSLSYSQACRLLIVSATLSVAILYFMLTMNWQSFALGPLVLALIAIYFSLGAIAYRRDMRQLARR
jgi:hypothetical protein